MSWIVNTSTVTHGQISGHVIRVNWAQRLAPKRPAAS